MPSLPVVWHSSEQKHEDSNPRVVVLALAICTLALLLVKPCWVRNFWIGADIRSSRYRRCDPCHMPMAVRSTAVSGGDKE